MNELTNDNIRNPINDIEYINEGNYTMNSEQDQRLLLTVLDVLHHENFIVLQSLFKNCKMKMSGKNGIRC